MAKKNRDRLGKSDYLEQLAPLQLQLNKLARWLQHTGKRLVVMIEGRDTAGKGGVINADRRDAEPTPVPRRGAAQAERARAHAVVLPALRARTCRRPARWSCSTAVGTTAPASSGDGLLQRRADRSFPAAGAALRELLVDDGILLLKYWLTVDQDQQEERFAERLEDPLKRWKLSPIDLQAREKYAEYGGPATRC